MVRMGDVWDRTTDFLGEHLSAVLPIVLLGIFVPLSVGNSLSELWLTAGSSAKVALTVGFVVIYLAVFWAYLALTAMAIDPALARRAGPVGLGRLPAGVGAYLILALVILALTIPLGVLLAASGIDVDALGRGEPMGPVAPGIGWALLIYLLLLFAAVVAATARLATMGAVVVAERRGAGAVVRAFRMTRGLTWKLIGVAILYGVVSNICAMAAKTVFGTVLRLFAGGEGALSVATVVTGIVVAAVSAAFTTLAAVFCAKLYVALAARAPAELRLDDPARP